MMIRKIETPNLKLPRTKNLAMVPFPGQWAVRQYLPNKSNKFVLKKKIVYAAKVGLILDFLIYQSKGTVPKAGWIGRRCSQSAGRNDL